MIAYKSTGLHEKLNCSFNRMRKCILTDTYHIYKYTVLINRWHTLNLGDFAHHKLNKKLSEQFSACV